MQQSLQSSQVGCETNLTRDRSNKLVAHEKQHFEFRLENATRNCTVHQVVVVQVQFLEIRESSKLGGDGTLELVVGPTENSQIRQPTNGGRNGARE